ncbi:MAG: hypothetical protein P0S93_04490 [Candidatus Neptunochlamydia sp.]|nr:hypothetical protein [Candidatus Neptunochlamydia sp.]
MTQELSLSEEKPIEKIRPLEAMQLQEMIEEEEAFKTQLLNRHQKCL